jgi:cobalamin biosynthesis Mg chelatase CobN
MKTKKMNLILASAAVMIMTYIASDADAGTDTSGNSVHATNGVTYGGTHDDTATNGSTASGGAGVNGGSASTDSAVAPAGGTGMSTTTTRNDTTTTDDRLAQQQQQQRLAEAASTGMPGWVWALFVLIVVGGVWYSVRYTNRHPRGRNNV